MACVSKRRGRWIVDYRVGLQRKIETFANRAEAETFKRDLLLRPLDQITGYQIERTTPLSKAVDQYLTLVTPRKAPGTQKLEPGYFSEFKSFVGNVSLDQITLGDLEAYQLKLKRRVCAATVNRNFNTLRNFFRKCEDWNFIQKNPALKLKNLPEAKKPIEIWRDEEIQRVIEAAPQWASDAFYFAAKTGARRGEVSNLIWDYVDLHEKTIQIKSIKGGQPRIRIVPMTESLHAFFLDLQNRRRRSLGSQRNVFLNGEGKPLSETHLSTAMNRAALKAGLEGLGLHGLRHSILTKMAAGNHSLRKIQQLAGHSSLATTERYLHLVSDSLRESLEIMEDKHHLVPLKIKV